MSRKGNIMKFYANGKEITEDEFNAINDRNIELAAKYDRTKDINLLSEMVFLTQIHEESDFQGKTIEERTKLFAIDLERK